MAASDAPTGGATTTSDGAVSRADKRWTARPVLGFLLAGAVSLVPVLVSVLVGWRVSHALPARPGWMSFFVRLAITLGASTATLLIAERLARKLLPLAALLRMTMVFPDRAPTRLAVARKAGSTASLQRRLEHGEFDEEPARAATAILSLAAGLNVHDRKTRGHSERVRALTDLVADELRLDQHARDRLRWSALLHDIGKLSVHPDVLNKPGKLDEAEWEAIRLHPLEGARLTGPLLPWLGEWALSIEQHHERWDGGGYPYGLSGEEISFAGRIVAVADSYETMTAARSYKRAMSAREAREELARCAGTQFDPAIVRAFLQVSIGKLRWAMGPLSWLAQLPFLGHLHAAAEAFSVAPLASGAAALGLTTALVLAPGVDPSTTTAPERAAAQSSAAASLPGAAPSRALAPRTVAAPGTDTSLPSGAESAPAAVDPSAATTVAPGVGGPKTTAPANGSPGSTAPPGTSPTTTATPGTTTTTRPPTSTTVAPTTTTMPRTTTTTAPKTTTTTTAPSATTTPPTTSPTTTAPPPGICILIICL